MYVKANNITKLERTTLPEDTKGLSGDSLSEDVEGRRSVRGNGEYKDTKA